MLKNKKILILILSFILLLCFSSNSLAYTVEEDVKNHNYWIEIFCDDGSTVYYASNYNDFYVDNSNCLVVEASSGYTAHYYYYEDDVLQRKSLSSSSVVSFVSIISSSHDIYYKETGELFFRHRGNGDSSDNTGSDSEGTGDTGDTSTDTERSGFFSSVIDWLSNLFSSITQGFKDVVSNIANILSYLNPLHENFILKDVLEFLGNILSYLNPFHENFILKTVIDYLNPFSENFLGKKIVELLENVIKAIFVPDEETISNLVNSVKSKFDFVDTIKFSITDLKDFLANIDESDNITMNLSNKYWSGTVTILNFSWFAQYKTYTDSVITAFIYIFYVWRLFISLPNIIAGLGGNVSPQEQIDDIQAFNKFGFGRRAYNKQQVNRRR